MHKYIVFLSALLFAMSISAVLSIEADTEDVSNAYRNAQATYKHVVPTRYNQIYKDNLQDRSSRKVWVEAARDYCLNNVNDAYFYGPRSERPFDCTSFGPDVKAPL